MGNKKMSIGIDDFTEIIKQDTALCESYMGKFPVIGRRGWIVKSNREAGKGRADIALIDRLKNAGIIIEVKYADNEKKLKMKAQEACKQIKDMDYKDFFRGFRIDKIEEYGIAFSGKECKVLKG